MGRDGVSDRCVLSADTSFVCKKMRLGYQPYYMVDMACLECTFIGIRFYDSEHAIRSRPGDQYTCDRYDHLPYKAEQQHLSVSLKAGRENGGRLSLACCILAVWRLEPTKRKHRSISSFEERCWSVGRTKAAKLAISVRNRSQNRPKKTRARVDRKGDHPKTSND